MRNLLALGTLAFCLSSLLVGVRMGRLAVRTRRLPETSFAVALLSAGVLGYGNAALSTSGVMFFPGLGLRTIHLALVGVGLGAAGVGLFTWRVFRLGSRWVPVVFAVGAGLIATSITVQIATGHGDARDLGGPWFWLGFALRASAYGWSGVESLRYFALMRRRLRHGLAERSLARRFLLWGIAASCAFAMHAPVAIDALRGSPRPGMEPVSSVVAALLGITAAVSLYLTFFGPARGRDSLASTGSA